MIFYRFFANTVLLFIMYPTLFAISVDLVKETNSLLNNYWFYTVNIFGDNFAIFDKVEDKEYNLKQLLEEDSDGKYVNYQNLQQKIRHLYLFTSCHNAKVFIKFISYVKPIIENYSLLNNEILKEKCVTLLIKNFEFYSVFYSTVKDSMLGFSSKLYPAYPDDLIPSIEILESITDFSNFELCKTKLYDFEKSICNFYKSNCRPVPESIQNNFIEYDTTALKVFSNSSDFNDVISNIDSVDMYLNDNIITCDDNYDQMGLKSFYFWGNSVPEEIIEQLFGNDNEPTNENFEESIVGVGNNTNGNSNNSNSQPMEND